MGSSVWFEGTSCKKASRLRYTTIYATDKVYDIVVRIYMYVNALELLLVPATMAIVVVENTIVDGGILANAMRTGPHVRNAAIVKVVFLMPILS
jgi:hypothetical protein